MGATALTFAGIRERAARGLCVPCALVMVGVSLVSIAFYAWVFA